MAALVPALLVLTLFISPVLAESLPLCERIDRAIAAVHLGPQAALADDAEFVRRIHLDLVGRIPTRDELQTFLSETSPDRRKNLIDRLLASDECNRHLAVAFDVMLMERRPDKYVSTDEWRRYLAESFAAGKPYHQLAAEILSASGDEGEEGPRAPAKFLLEREVEGHAITRDVARLFLGRDVQCAQCHDHPLVSDYSQAEYYGLLAFLNRSFRFEQTLADKQTVSLIGERAEGEVSYASVFEPGAAKVTALPALPNGIALDDEPLLAADQAYRVAPEKNVRPIPHLSRRQQLARLTADGRSDLFRQNIANRLWRMMMRQGLVEPPDLIHSDNPASYPLLLEELADAFAEMNYDVKQFLRQIALSQAYQRSIAIPDELLHDAEHLVDRMAEWKQQRAFQEQAVDRAEEAKDDAAARLQSVRASVLATRDEITAALQQQEQALKQQSESRQQKTAVREQREKQAAVAEALRVAAEQAQQAVAQRKEDSELAAAGQLLSQRAATALQELNALDQQLAQHEEAIQQADQSIANATGQLTALRETHQRKAARAKEESGAFRALKNRCDAETARVVQLSHQLKLAELTIALRDAERSLARADAHREALLARQGASAATRRELRAAQARHEAECKRAAEQVESARQQLVLAQHDHQDHHQLLTGLRSAAQQVAAARDQLQGDDQLNLAHQHLARRVEQLERELVDQEQRVRQAREHLQACEQACQVTQGRVQGVVTDVTELDTREAELATSLATAQSAWDEAEVQATRARERMRKALTERFVVASIQALSPEQLAASVIVALNLAPRFRAEAEAEWQNNNQEKPADQVDAAQRETEIEALTAKRRGQVESSFVSLFASTPGSPQDTFFATVDQALFLANDGRIQNWIGPAHGNLAAQLRDLENPATLAQTLYRSVLSREPTADEQTAVSAYLGARPEDRAATIQELIWSLLTSVEFRFNH